MMIAQEQKIISNASEIDKIYFPNLNGIRFIASTFVVVCHIETINRLTKGDALLTQQTASVLGRLGVVLFFALSGFLITYLLLSEQRKIGRISVKDFYIRRILRIWPLYYFIILLAFFALPRLVPPASLGAGVDEYFIVNLVLYLLFVPNLAAALYPNVLGATQA